MIQKIRLLIINIMVKDRKVIINNRYKNQKGKLKDQGKKLVLVWMLKLRNIKRNKLNKDKLLLRKIRKYRN